MNEIKNNMETYDESSANDKRDEKDIILEDNAVVEVLAYLI